MPFDKTLNELPTKVIIEIFEKINLKEYKTFMKISTINKQFNGVYKKYFEENIKKEYHKVDFGKKVTVQILRNGDLFYGMYLNVILL